MPPNNVSKKSTALAKYKTPLIVLAISVVGLVMLFFLILFLPSSQKTTTLSRSDFGFNIVTVDANGNKNPPQSRNSKQFTVDLGNGVKLEMVSILEGTFLMGSPDNEAGRTTAEGPQHTVTVKPFYMSRFPVTQAQWEQVANLPEAKLSLNPNPSTFMGASRPVETVSWEEAVEFCERLTRKFGGKYSLPSEAQWEYACRANTTLDKPTTPFYFGETITPELANYDVNYPYGSGPRGKKEEYNGETIEVNHHQAPNNFGLEDMHGNVWEWCADPWHENYNNQPPLDGSVWESDDKSSPPARVVRGGAWHSFPSSCRCATRTKMPQNIRTNTVGFRVVWLPPQNN